MWISSHLCRNTPFQFFLKINFLLQEIDGQLWRRWRAYPNDDLESDEDKPLHVTKHHLEKEKEAEDTTPMPPQSSWESAASMEATPEGKQKKRICTKADLEQEQKREQVIECAEKLLGQAQDFDPELKFYCSSLMLLLEKLDFETCQRCMIAVRQVIFKFMFPKQETAARPMWAHHCRQGGAAAESTPPPTPTAGNLDNRTPWLLASPPPPPKAVRVNPAPVVIPDPEADEGLSDMDLDELL